MLHNWYNQETTGKVFLALTCYLAFNNSLPSEKYNYWDPTAEEKHSSTFWQSSKFNYPAANQSNVCAASNETAQMSPHCFQLNMFFLLFKKTASSTTKSSHYAEDEKKSIRVIQNSREQCSWNNKWWPFITTNLVWFFFTDTKVHDTRLTLHLPHFNS